MEEFEAVRAYRPLMHPDQIDTIEAIAGEIMGEGVFDFHDHTLNGRDVVLLGTGEIYNSIHNNELARQLSCDRLLELARENMPASYGEPRHVGLVGKLSIARMNTDEGRKKVITAPIEKHGFIKEEKIALRGIFDQCAAHELDWPRRHQLRIKLATVATDEFISEDRLRRIAQSLPRKVYTERGRIKPIAISHDGYRDLSPAV